LALVIAALASSGCLVLSLQPAYDDESIERDDSLVGVWIDEEDRVTATVERGEWRSYRVKYEHPIETGVLTVYLTTIGGQHYLDLSPVRGEDRGSFLVPVHAIVRIERTPETLVLQGLDYDRFGVAFRAHGVPGLTLTMDQKQNVLVTDATAAWRKWLGRNVGEVWLGARAVFKKKSASPQLQ
jgi:hypothetical protein